MTFEEAIYQIQKQVVGIMSADQVMAMAIELMKADAMQRQADAVRELANTIHNELVLYRLNTK